MPDTDTQPSQEKTIARRHSRKLSKLPTEAADLDEARPTMDTPPTMEDTAARSQSKKRSKSPVTESSLEVGQDVPRVPTNESSMGRSKSRKLSKATGDTVASEMQSQLPKDEAMTSARIQSKRLSKSSLPQSVTGKDAASQAIKEEPMARRPSRKLSKSPSDREMPTQGDVTQPTKDTSIPKNQPEKLNKFLVPKPGTEPDVESKYVKADPLARRQSKKMNKPPMETTPGLDLNVPRNALSPVKGEPKSLEKIQKKLSKSPTGTTPGLNVETIEAMDKTRPSKKLGKPPMDVVGANLESVSQPLRIEDDSKNQSALTEEPSGPTKKRATAARGQSKNLSEMERNEMRPMDEGMMQVDKSSKRQIDVDRATKKESLSGQSKKLGNATVETSSLNLGTASQSLTKDKSILQMKKFSKEITETASAASSSQEPYSASVQTGAIQQDVESQPSPPKDEKRSTTTRLSNAPLSKEVSEEVKRRSEAIKTLLVSSDILQEEETILEEEIEEEPLPKPGNSHFKFLKSRCGKLINTKSWTPSWQGFNMLEDEATWKLVDDWAPTKQFIRYQEDLVVWQHDHPLAQHIGLDRGCWAKYYKRPIISSSWDN